MLLRPTLRDFKIVGYYCGRLITGLGWVMLLPILVAAAYSEINPLMIFLISAFTCFIVGYLLTFIFYNQEDLSFLHSLIIVPSAWLLASLLGAQPLFLSGHYLSFFDATFEAMSAFTTSGLSLTVDLDHMSASMNFWRHLMMFLGGQGIVVIALTILSRTAGGIFGLYASEGKEEKILPNVVQTARFIWIVSITFLVIGTVAMSAIMIYEGMHPGRSVIQSASLFMAAFDTGGFAPHSQSILYYHSGMLETALIFFMVFGCINFGVHYAIWSGKHRELIKNVEVIAFTSTILLTFMITAIGLAKAATYTGYSAFFQKGFFQLVSAHTGTGFMTIYAPQFKQEWPSIALVTIIMAMALGGSMSSTSGGIKALRVAIVFILFKLEIKKLVLPPAAVIVAKYHHLKTAILSEAHFRNALLIILAYIVTYLLGTLFGLYYGYDLTQALFESVSAAANVGLSTGVTSTDMPDLLKLVYMFQMWSGRLEFLSLFAIIGVLWAMWKGK